MLPAEIEELEQKIALVEAELSSPDLYVSDNQRFYKLTEQLESFKQQKDAKETRWLEIEMLKSSL